MKVNTDTTLMHYAFPSIGQFSNVVYNVNHNAHYTGKDDNGDPVYDKSLPMPIIKYVGTCKLHGTNGSFIVDFHNDRIYFQSRENVVAPLKDNAGFAFYMSSIQEDLLDMVRLNILANDIDWEKNVIGVYGEWCGSSIQKGVALAQLEKMFVVFAVAIINRETKQAKWISIEDTKKYKISSKKIYNIYDYPIYEIEIDFSAHYTSINKIVDMTITVEDMCPVAKQFGVEGIGEGIVFRSVDEKYVDSGYWFKSKGEKHAKSKVKTVKPVDDEKINKFIEMANKVTPSWRLEQIFNLTFDTLNGGLPTRNKIGDYLKNVNSDIIKEELHTISDAGIEFKEIVGHVGKIVRDYFFSMEKEFLSVPLK